MGAVPMSTPEMTGGPAVDPQPVAGPLTRAAIFLVVALNPGDDSRVRRPLALRRSRRAGSRGGVPRPGW